MAAAVDGRCRLHAVPPAATSVASATVARQTFSMSPDGVQRAERGAQCNRVKIETRGHLCTSLEVRDNPLVRRAPCIEVCLATLIAAYSPQPVRFCQTLRTDEHSTWAAGPITSSEGLSADLVQVAPLGSRGIASGRWRLRGASTVRTNQPAARETGGRTGRR